MKRYLIPILLVLLPAISKAQVTEDLATQLRLKIEQLRGGGLQIEGQRICCGQSIANFYTNRIFETIWTDNLASQLLEEIRKSELEGFNPEDYHLSILSDLDGLDQLNTYERANYELLLTDSFLLLATHLLSGKVNPTTLNPDWRVVKREGDPVDLLAQAITTNDMKSVFSASRPTYKAYTRLVEKLSKYREIEQSGGWGQIANGPTLKPGQSDERVLQVRKRLLASGDLVPYTNDEPELYDDQLKQAVSKYQQRYGLEVDGAIGQSTLMSMNEPVETRIEDIVLNLERCRWLPRTLGDHYILVNLPAYEMEVVRSGQVSLEMGVAVGKPYRQTPVFTANMTYMVLNPYWTVPPTILYQDMIPAQIKNPSYLNSLQIKVLDQSGQEVDPATINWAGYTKNFPYTLRQEPGKVNALGRVKFIFPNEFNIYMHDTNHPEVFAKYNRALSSGCVRLSQPLELAYYLGQFQNRPLTKPELDEISASKTNQTIILSKPIPVHMQYWTAFVDESGVLNFRPDIYDRNARLRKAFFSSL
ncbi:L,D-transpeptidase family protein [Marinoscillum sp.]|uniref:L,D-transpeptidase family protein n=1 Tax=Marinoscillum sp. TaxID=2024838 RepID=UPI003BAA6AF0